MISDTSAPNGCAVQIFGVFGNKKAALSSLPLNPFSGAWGHSIFCTTDKYFPVGRGNLQAIFLFYRKRCVGSGRFSQPFYFEGKLRPPHRRGERPAKFGFGRQTPRGIDAGINLLHFADHKRALMSLYRLALSCAVPGSF